MRVISFTVVSLVSTLRWSVKTSIFVIFCFCISVKKFFSGDFSLKDEQRSGRPNEVDDQIKAIIESDRHVSVREMEEMLKIPKSTIDRHIQRLRLVKKFDIWIPHELK